MSEMTSTLASRPIDELDSYRAVSTLAVAALLLGCVSLLGLVDVGLLLTLPPVAMIVSFIALRRLRSHRDTLTGRGLALAGFWLGASFFIGGSVLNAYQYATEVPEGYTRLSFAELQPDPKVPGQVIPPRALELDGQKVFIKGYVFPGRQTKGIREFMLVWNNGDCCFGGTPPLTHMIVVQLIPPLDLTFTSRQVRVGGTFHARRSSALNGLGEAVYQIDADYLP